MLESRTFKRLLLAVVLLPILSKTVHAHGDRVVPQVADGAGVIRTKLDISNLSSDTSITRLKIHFHRQDGSPWFVNSNLGTGDVFRLDLGRNQTLRFETLGLSPGVTAGYAVIRNTEDNAPSSRDFRISVSVFYEVLDGNKVLDTVSVPVGSPTLRWLFPVETDSALNLHSGFALVNLSDSDNRVRLQLWNASTTSVADASDGGAIELTLRPREQRARFLSETGLFPDRPRFKGILTGTAEKPVAVLGLLQTQSAGGLQYSTLAVERIDSLHSESYLFLPQSGSLDADVPLVPFVTMDDNGSRDVLFQSLSGEVRSLTVQNGAAFSPLGLKTSTEFNNLTLEDLRAAPYGTLPIDMSDISANLAVGYSFAVRTSQGRFAKVRVARVLAAAGAKDLVLQLYVYR